MKFEYLFASELFNVGNNVFKCSCQKFQIFWPDTDQHELFFNLLIEELRTFVKKEGTEGDDFWIDAYEDDSSIVLTNDLYCRIIPQLQGIVMRCVRELQCADLGLE